MRQLPGNRLGYGAFMRALLVALFEWVERGIAPPDSRFPSRAAGTLVSVAEARATFPRLPQVNFPNVLNELRLRDHSVEPPIESTVYPVFVQSTDADGNALGGIRYPLLAYLLPRMSAGRCARPAMARVTCSPSRVR